MANVEKVSIALTPELASTVREALASGEYASVSELMREALREWKHHRVERNRAMEEIGRLWDEGLASGPAVDGEEAFKNLRRKFGSSPRSSET
jgi:antitoxin ParD1/3/4